MLIKDVMIFPNAIDAQESSNDYTCSETLNNESIDLWLSLMTLKELESQFVSVGADE